MAQAMGMARNLQKPRRGERKAACTCASVLARNSFLRPFGAVELWGEVHRAYGAQRAPGYFPAPLAGLGAGATIETSQRTLRH